ncbi:SusC/RagA family TonB-linked outer membrane protein [Reichenbachiella ulvae]|uniref:TonB-dependent receptor n=1 Tax=Reichenbachiella ulvae TaxID=2980104 RepID=A0ABT3CNX6_9BACT|nr:TonB-dependent receptor [Reichenbachiella ulvae]MCV9385297.1 TonB-dependent receptor [Reichenbachiella ulvae]
MNKFFTAIVLMLISLPQLQAQVSVSGQVISAEDGVALPGVNVVQKGSTVATVTDVDGNYSIKLTQEDAVLTFSFIGMENQEVEVLGRSVVDVELQSDTKQLDEVLVVGYGVQKRTDVTSSVQQVDSDLLENVPASYSFENALQGQTAGVNISSSSATPGAAINMNIRGVTSISASSQPLFVIDGVPLVSRNNSALNSNIQPVNPLADINSNDIESITVLKDAAAASVYGSRGANGVILITTKRGAVGKTKFNVGYYTGVSEISNVPELMNAKQWIEFLNVAAENDGLGENYWNSRLGDPNDPNLKTYNAYDEIFRTGITHNADVSIQGGNEKTKFYLSGNYYNQEGIQVGTAFERMSGRLNIDHSVNSKLGVGTNVMVSRTNHARTINENDEYGVVINAQAWDPTAPLKNDEGNYTNPFSYYGWWALENPLFIAEQYRNDAITDRVLGTAFLTYDIFDDLTFKTTWSADMSGLTEESFTPAGGNETDIGEGIFATYDELTWVGESTLTYNKTLGLKHNVSVLAGYSIQESRALFSETLGTNFPSNNVYKISTAATTTGSSGETSYGFQSFIGRLNYNFASKYLVSLSIRTDASSRFGTNNQYGTFPSASLGWVVSEESFLSGQDVLNYLKFRASYGIIGNAEISNFGWRGVYNLESPYNGAGGIAPSTLENPNLGWEQTTQLNIGTDFQLFDGRIGVTGDYFEKTTEDLLFNADVPGTTGFANIPSNFGSIKNTGFEISVNANLLSLGDFKWDMNANFSHIKNEVVEIQNDGQIVSRNFILQEGESLSQLHLIKFLGVDPLTGDAVFEDVNSDGVINSDDKQAVGSGIPTMFGGWTNSFSYKGLSLSVLFQYVGGNKIFNQSRHAYENYGSLQSGLPYGNQSIESLDYWKEPGDITRIPRPSLAGPNESNAQWQRFSTQYLEDGDFVRLKNVKLSYNLPSDWVSKVGLETVNIYLQGRNLYTWTQYKGFDPEVSTNTSSQEDLNTLQGEDFGTLGQARTYSIGVNIGF